MRSHLAALLLLAGACAQPSVDASNESSPESAVPADLSLEVGVTTREEIDAFFAGRVEERSVRPNEHLLSLEGAKDVVYTFSGGGVLLFTVDAEDRYFRGPQHGLDPPLPDWAQSIRGPSLLREGTGWEGRPRFEYGTSESEVRRELGESVVESIVEVPDGTGIYSATYRLTGDLVVSCLFGRGGLINMDAGEIIEAHWREKRAWAEQVGRLR